MQVVKWLKMEDLKNYLIANDNVVFAYLFGSYAKGVQTAKSDVDLAIYLDDNRLDMQLQINYELSKILRKDVDLVILNNVKNMYLLESIFRDSVILKDNPKRIDFELQKQHQILDFKAFKRMLGVA